MATTGRIINWSVSWAEDEWISVEPSLELHDFLIVTNNPDRKSHFWLTEKESSWEAAGLLLCSLATPSEFLYTKHPSMWRCCLCRWGWPPERQQSAVEVNHLVAVVSNASAKAVYESKAPTCLLHLHLLQVAVQQVLLRRQEPILLQPQDQLRLLVGLKSQEVHEALAERPVLRRVLFLRAARDDHGPRGPPLRRNVRLGK